MNTKINPAAILASAAASANAGDAYDNAYQITIRDTDHDAERAKAHTTQGRADARSVVRGVHKAAAILDLVERRAARLPGAGKRLAKARARAVETLADYACPPDDAFTLAQIRANAEHGV